MGQEPEYIGDVLRKCDLPSNTTRFNVGEKVFWRRNTRNDMSGMVMDVRDGRVLVRFRGRGPWTNTSRWLDPDVLRKEGEEWR